MEEKAGKQLKLKPLEFEKKYQQEWLKHRIYQPDMKSAKRPFYNLMMFPYPSAEGLHVGNMYAFTGADIYGRFQRMRGYDVFEPIGLDGFGIHSENYAIKIGKHPKEQAKVSEQNFYRQLQAIGNGFAWENRLETYDPDYYRWTQWIFVQMFKHGLAYRKKSPVNFCPKDKTVLSDEQVIDGACERCGTLVEKREMEQWFFRITDYAERLLEGLSRIDWPEKVKIGQRNWIGKKEGINIGYPVIAESAEVAKVFFRTSQARSIHSASGYVHGARDAGGSAQKTWLPADSSVVDEITCFTTRPDTNFGATFVVMAPEHPFVKEISNIKYQISNDKLKEIADYVEKGKKKKPQERIAEGREKTGVFTGLYCLNQLNDYKMPLFISDFVLVEFGTGAVVGVPGHDKRDFEFAKKFKLPIKRVVVGSDGDKSPIKQIEQVQEEEGKMINSDFLDGMDIHEATKVMMDYLEEKGWGKRVTTYRLRDWCISRQRYWGAPIPMVYCSTCASEGRSWFTSQEAKDSLGNFKFQISNLKSNPNSKNLKAKISEEIDGWYPINEENLPVLLPDLSDWQPEGTGKGPLAKLKDWVKVKCPNCGGDADRETDVCDTFLDSSWYHLRYPSVNKVEKVDKVEESRFNPSTSTTSSTFSLPWDPEITKKWLPVTQYIGGAEHTVLHLLYARFVSMAFYDWKIIDFDEPYSRFFAHGLIIAEGAKMSKSRGNVIVPDEYIRAYGADTLRTYLMFLGPFEAGGDFRDTGIAGMYRFLSRVYRLVNEYFSSDPKQLDSLSAKDNADRLNKIMHKTIKDVTEDIAQFHYNTAIAKIMEYVNFLTNNKSLITNNHIKSLLLMLAPFAPHMTEELWQLVNSQSKSVPAKGGVSRSQSEFKSIHLEAWPEYNPKFLVEDEVTIAVQVNGKTRETLTMENGKWKMENEVRKKAEESEKVKKYTVGKKIKKVIFVPGKIINFVI